MLGVGPFRDMLGFVDEVHSRGDTVVEDEGEEEEEGREDVHDSDEYQRILQRGIARMENCGQWRNLSS